MYQFFQTERSSKPIKAVALSLLLVGVIAAVAVYSTRPSPLALQQFMLEEQEFHSFINSHKKNYKDESEYNTRFQIFRDNLAYIRVFNSLGKDWTLGVNHMADLTAEEFKSMYTGYVRRERESSKNFADLSSVSVPATVDWTTKGAVPSQGPRTMRLMLGFLNHWVS